MANRNNSDYMSRKMDKDLEQLEERLTALYANAGNEVRAEFTDFMADYQKQYEQMRLLLEAEDITQAEFDRWCKTKIINTDKYKNTINTLTNTLVNTDVAAMAAVNSELPLALAQSYNFVQSLGFKAADEAGLSVGTFQIYNAKTVEKIIKDNPDLLPNVDIPVDKKWNKDRINREITQGIVQGDSIPQVADRLQHVTNMDKNAAIRNARTSMTAAENLGRSESAKELKDKGIPIKEQWIATHDSRTRDSHLLLDGTFKSERGYYGEGIIATPLRFPADPLGDPEEIYNCRCRDGIVLNGIDHSQDDKLYEQFMQENYPKDWAAIQSSEQEQFKKATAQAAEERKADLQVKQDISKSIDNVGDFRDRKAVVNTLADMEETERDNWVKAIQHTEYTINNKDTESEFSYQTGKVALNDKADAATFFHETAHAIDGNAVYMYMETKETKGGETTEKTTIKERPASSSAMLIYNNAADNIEKDNAAFMQFAGIDNLDDTIDNIKAVRSAIRDFGDEYGADAELYLSDIVDAYTKGNFYLIQYTGGHNKDYWQSPVTVSMEMWSDICALKASGNEEAFEAVKAILPQTVGTMEDMYNAVFLEDYCTLKQTEKSGDTIKETMYIFKRSDNI